MNESEKVSLIRSSSSLMAAEDETASAADKSDSSSIESSSSSSTKSSKSSKKESGSAEKAGEVADTPTATDNFTTGIELGSKKKKMKKKEKKMKTTSKKDKKKEGESLPQPPPASDDAAFKAMLGKLVKGAKTGSAQKLKSFVKNFSAHSAAGTAFLSYGPLLEQAGDIAAMLVAMLNAPNNVPEALGALFCLTRSPVFADIFAVTEGSLCSVALFITDTALVQEKDRAKVDEYGIGILSNVGHSPDGKKRLTDIIDPPVLVRYLSTYYKNLAIMKFVVNVLASLSLVSKKFRKAVVKYSFVHVIVRKVVPMCDTDEDALAVCCWCLRVLALCWRGSVQVKMEYGPTSIFFALHKCKCGKTAAMHAFPTLVLMIDKDTIDEFHGAYVMSVCSKTLEMYVGDNEVLTRCLKLLDVLLAEEDFPEDALDSKALTKNLMKVVRKNAASDSVVQPALRCAVQCARFSSEELLEKIGGEKVMRKTLKAVKKAKALSKESTELAAELTSIYNL